jgi:hypothetical protein
VAGALRCPPPLIAEVKNEWSCTSLSPLCLHAVDRDSILYLLNNCVTRYWPQPSVAKAAV